MFGGKCCAVVWAPNALTPCVEWPKPTAFYFFGYICVQFGDIRGFAGR